MAFKRAISLQEYEARKAKRGQPARSQQKKRRSGGWSPPILLGDRLRIQAIDGYRAAVITLRPGLYLVSEVKSESLEFGLASLLLPLLSHQMAKVAERALQRHGQADANPNALSIPTGMVRWVQDAASKAKAPTDHNE